MSRSNELSGAVANELSGFMIPLEVLGVSDRTFRRYLVDYKQQAIQGLVDDRWSRISHRKAPVNEIMELKELYRPSAPELAP